MHVKQISAKKQWTEAANGSFESLSTLVYPKDKIRNQNQRSMRMIDKKSVPIHKAFVDKVRILVTAWALGVDRGESWRSEFSVMLIMNVLQGLLLSQLISIERLLSTLSVSIFDRSKS